MIGAFNLKYDCYFPGAELDRKSQLFIKDKEVNYQPGQWRDDGDLARFLSVPRGIYGGAAANAQTSLGSCGGGARGRRTSPGPSRHLEGGVLPSLYKARVTSLPSLPVLLSPFFFLPFILASPTSSWPVFPSSSLLLLPSSTLVRLSCLVPLSYLAIPDLKFALLLQIEIRSYGLLELRELQEQS